MASRDGSLAGLGRTAEDIDLDVVGAGTPDPSTLLGALADFEPTIPAPVIKHYLGEAGCEVNDPVLLKVIALTTQRFVSDVAKDARSEKFLRTKSAAESGSRKTITMADLSSSLREQGIDVAKPPYFAP